MIESKKDVQRYIKTMNDVMLHQRIEKDLALIISLKSDLQALVSGICNARADIPPYLIQLAKDVKKRHLNENDQSAPH